MELTPAPLIVPTALPNQRPSAGVMANLQAWACGPEDERQVLIARGHSEATQSLGLWRKLLNAYSWRENLVSITARPASAIKCLDGLRAWAVCAVMGFHGMWFVGLTNGVDHKMDWSPEEPKYKLLRLWFMQPFLAGDMGVDVFFVLSGFLVSFILIKEYNRNEGNIKFTRYFINRWIRLAPALMASMIVGSLFDPITAWTCSRWGWANLTFMNNLFGPQVHDGCLGHTWSVAVEAQFYVVTPWLLRHVMRRGPLLITILCAASLLTNLALVSSYGNPERYYIPKATIVYDKPYTRCVPYLCGMLVAYAYEKQWKPSGALKVVCDWCCVLLLLSLSFLGAGNTLRQQEPPWFNGSLIVVSRPLYGASLAYCVLMMMNGHFPRANSILSHPFWVPMARLSYSAYLFQFMVIYPVLESLHTNRAESVPSIFVYFIILTLGTITGSFVMSFICYMLVEKPGMNLRSS